MEGRGWAHSVAHPWVPIISPLTHMVYLIPFFSHLAGSKSVSVRPTRINHRRPLHIVTQHMFLVVQCAPTRLKGEGEARQSDDPLKSRLVEELAPLALTWIVLLMMALPHETISELGEPTMTDVKIWRVVVLAASMTSRTNRNTTPISTIVMSARRSNRIRIGRTTKVDTPSPTEISR